MASTLADSTLHTVSPNKSTVSGESHVHFTTATATVGFGASPMSPVRGAISHSDPIGYSAFASGHQSTPLPSGHLQAHHYHHTQHMSLLEHDINLCATAQSTVEMISRNATGAGTSQSSGGRGTVISRDIRNIRNLAEKHRRDKLNGYINDLASIVPFVINSKKKLDKTSILRLSAAYLRFNNTFQNLKSNQSNDPVIPPVNSRTQQIYDSFLNTLESFSGFTLIANGQGKILYVSSAIEKYLGHLDNEVIGHALSNFVHPNDRESVQCMVNGLVKQILNGSNESDRITFQCRLREKNQPRTDSISYRSVRISGHIACSEGSEGSEWRKQLAQCPLYSSGKSAPLCSNCSAKSAVAGQVSSCNHSQSAVVHYCGQSQEASTSNAMQSFASASPFATSPLSDKDLFFGSPSSNVCMVSNNSGGSGFCPSLTHAHDLGASLVLLCFVEVMPIDPVTELKLVDTNFDEYISRHSLDGTLLYADHRIASVIGFFPTEVHGKSAYDFILPDDYSIALFAHKLMLSNSNGTGVVVHRLRAVDNSAVFLQTAGCLQYNSNGQIDHFICVSRMLVESEGDKERDKFVKRFTPHIYNQSPSDLYESLKLVINPYAGSVAAASTLAAAQASTPQINPLVEQVENRLMPAYHARHERQKSPVQPIPPIKAPPVPASSLETGVTELKPLNVMEWVNAMTAQAALRKLETQRNRFVTPQPTPSQQSSELKSTVYQTATITDYEPAGKAAAPKRISTSDPVTLPSKRARQSTDSVKIEEAREIPVSEAQPNPGNSAETKYELAHGQRDYTHLLGARVLTYNNQHRAQVLSIYTPPAALSAQERGRLICQAPTQKKHDSHSSDEPTSQPGMQQAKRSNNEDQQQLGQCTHLSKQCHQHQVSSNKNANIGQQQGEESLWSNFYHLHHHYYKPDYTSLNYSMPNESKEDNSEQNEMSPEVFYIDSQHSHQQSSQMASNKGYSSQLSARSEKEFDEIDEVLNEENVVVDEAERVAAVVPRTHHHRRTGHRHRPLRHDDPQPEPDDDSGGLIDSANEVSYNFVPVAMENDYRKMTSGGNGSGEHHSASGGNSRSHHSSDGKLTSRVNCPQSQASSGKSGYGSSMQHSYALQSNHFTGRYGEWHYPASGFRYEFGAAETGTETMITTPGSYHQTPGESSKWHECFTAKHTELDTLLSDSENSFDLEQLCAFMDMPDETHDPVPEKKNESPTSNNFYSEPVTSWEVDQFWSCQNETRHLGQQLQSNGQNGNNEATVNQLSENLCSEETEIEPNWLNTGISINDRQSTFPVRAVKGSYSMHHYKSPD